MIIINPKVELIGQGEDAVKHIARCARVCYGKDSGDDERLYNNLIKNKHWSVFRHWTYYAIVPKKKVKNTNLGDFLSNLSHYEYNSIGIDVKLNINDYYVVFNGNYALDYPLIYEQLQPYLVSEKEFDNIDELAWNMRRFTFKIVTQISTSRELNRTSPNNITEASSRYISLINGAICRPHWMSGEEANNYNNGDCSLFKPSTRIYLMQCESAFDNYGELIKEEGFKREDARGILPLDTATTVIYTYSVKEWKHIVDLRSAKSAHPNAAIIANMIKAEFYDLSYDF